MYTDGAERMCGTLLLQCYFQLVNNMALSLANSSTLLAANISKITNSTLRATRRFEYLIMHLAYLRDFQYELLSNQGADGISHKVKRKNMHPQPNIKLIEFVVQKGISVSLIALIHQ
jgi:hypothetical protein